MTLRNSIYSILKEMIKMNIIEIRSDKVYKKIMNAPVNKKEDI
ncbi:hypothetical protein [Clostridioides sp. GD02376]